MKPIIIAPFDFSFDQNRNWYEGFAIYTPSTNNALESFNRLIKDEQTFRERLDLSHFRFTIFAMVKQWLDQYVHGANQINESTHIDLKLWTAGYNFAKSDVKIAISRQQNETKYRISLSEEIDDSINWTTFDQFKEKSFAFYDTVFISPVTKDNWMKGICDCKEFFKQYICHHIIGISIRLKILTVPLEAKSIPIGEKRKRGRPAKSKSALQYQ